MMDAFTVNAKFQSGIDFQRVLAFTSAEVRLEETFWLFPLFSKLAVIMKSCSPHALP